MLNVEADCPFCGIVRTISGENDLALAFRDMYPVSPGHTLVIPKRHVASYFACTPDEKAAIWSLVDEIQSELDDEYFLPDGFNVGLNDGAAAGQTVWHCHIHVIPRRVGDMDDPRGGIRHCVTGKGYYKARGGLAMTGESLFNVAEGSK